MTVRDDTGPVYWPLRNTAAGSDDLSGDGANPPVHTVWCGYCERAKALLDSRGLAYDEVSLDGVAGFQELLLERTGRWTVPQVEIDGRPIGGYVELRELERAGALADLAG